MGPQAIFISGKRLPTGNPIQLGILMNAFIMVISTPGLDDLEWVRHCPWCHWLCSWVREIRYWGNNCNDLVWQNTSPGSALYHLDGRAKWKGHTGVHHFERRVGGAVIGGTLPLRLRAMAVEPGTRSYGAKLRVRLFPMRGKTFILVFSQGLWFGDRIDRSLVNPNQCRAFGISFCDDPTDTHRALGFHTDKVLIELFMK